MRGANRQLWHPYTIAVAIVSLAAIIESIVVAREVVRPAIGTFANFVGLLGLVALDGFLLAFPLGRGKNPDDREPPLALPEPRIEPLRAFMDGSSSREPVHAPSAVRPLPSAPNADMEANSDSVPERQHWEVLRDRLAAVPDRNAIYQTLATALERSRAHGSMVAVLFVDIAGCDVADAPPGFPATEICIALATERLVQCAGDGAVVGRFRSTGFVVVCTGELRFSDIRSRAVALIDAFARPFPVLTHDLACTLSVGIDCSADGNATAQTIVGNADTAMVQAQLDGRNLIRFYTATMGGRTADKLTLEVDLRQAIAAQAIDLHYLPIVARNGRICAFEALARWSHASRGDVPPDVFIPLAEDGGTMVPLGSSIMRQACTDLHFIRGRFADVRLAVNISSRQLQHPDFDIELRQILSETGTLPGNIDLEITESAIMADLPLALPMLGKLRAAGFRISIDDFGTGYSSLAYLKHLPLDMLKIDRSFVREISDDILDGAIPSAIVALARSLGLGVIAEGVESETQRAYLAHLGCDEFQGFLFSRPAPLEAVLALPTQLRGRGPRVAALAAVPATRREEEILYARRS